MELVTGATGYVGSRLVERLASEGRPVRALARDPSRLEPRQGVEPVRADLVAGTGLDRALDGCEAAYYLVHSMERMAGPRLDDGFAGRDRIAAEHFAAAARKAGVRKLVYLGGIVPDGEAELSPHLASRLEVERILLEAAAESTALRASILVGAQSSSFRILVRLVERLRFLPFPAWSDHRTAPIDERDAIEYLARAPRCTEAAGLSLDITGADVLSYAAMIERIADIMGVGRMPVRLGVSLTPVASPIVARVTGQPLELVRPLMYSLERDLLPRNDDARRIFAIRPRRFERAVEHALGEWERDQELAAR